MTDPEVKRRLLDALWSRDREYYRKAEDHVRAAGSSGEYDWLRRMLPASGRILEVGCGDGVHFEVLAAAGRVWYGCDLSKLAASLAARRALPSGAARVVVADAEALPFVRGAFDAVLAVSVLEHLSSPERALDGMIAALAPGGRLCLLSPQYGAPLGASPCRAGGGARRFVGRFLRAHAPGGGGERLGWERVRPSILDGAAYTGDEDTVVEPELVSLVRFLEGRGLTIVEASSGLAWRSWRVGRMTTAQSLARLLFEKLGRAAIPPYASWGPLVCVCAAAGGGR